MMSRVLRKCQFTEPDERSLLASKIEREIKRLEEWFKRMISPVGNPVNKYSFFLRTYLSCSQLTGIL
jgi:hypothetical protein